MTITSTAELKFRPRLPQSSLGNFSSPSLAGIMDLPVPFAFRSSYSWVWR
jgi:hypothetical protein